MEFEEDDENENNYNMGMNNDNMIDNNEIEDNMNDNYNEMGEENEIDNDYQNDNNDYNFNENDFDNQIEQDDNFNNEKENYDENDYYMMNMENIKLKDKIQKLNQLLYQKNNEINNLKVNFSKQYQLMTQNLNKYKIMAKNSSNLQNEINLTKQKYLKEIKMKNKIISDLQKGVEIKDLKVSNLTFDDNQNTNLIFTITQQIKTIEQNILEEPDSDKLNLEDFQKLDNDQQIQFLLNEIKIFSQKLTQYKNNNMSEILRLRNVLDSNEAKHKNIKDQNYLDIIDSLKNLSKNNINDIALPEYSLNDTEEQRKNNVFKTIKILVEYIIDKKNRTEKNELDEELNKRLKEMSELLTKSSQNLSISTKNNSELKSQYNKLKEEYDNLVLKNENEKKKLMNDLNKKNQQIKSLEHINTRLSNQINESKEEDKKNINKKPMTKYGKITKNKNAKKKNENNIDKINLFIKDEKSEKTLELFLNKFTNGEYEKFLKINNNNKENIDLDNLKKEIDKFNNKINNINKDSESEDKK